MLKALLRAMTPKRSRPRAGRRNYEIAQASRFYDNHFLNADNSDADRLIEEDLETVRNRCRYEVRNNCYAEGIVETLANDIVGTGPQLQVQSSSDRFNRKVEQRWSEFCQSCDLAGRLELVDILKMDVRQLCESGESFTALLADDTERLFLRLLAIESDRINSPLGNVLDDSIRQGIKVDAVGKPLFYYVQKTHPGAAIGGTGTQLTEYDQIGAAQMIHLARLTRPGQTRSMPWLQPALPLFSHLRRFEMATVTSAETAANYSGVIKTDGSLGSTDDVESLEEIDIARGQLLTMPNGWDMQQFKAEHPTATFKDFKHEILNEMARCLNMPFNIAAGNSAGYNYASGRLDWQIYFRFVSTIQSWIARHKLNRIFAAWLSNAALMPGYIPTPPVKFTISPKMVSWYWPGTEHVDPVKEANGEKIRLESGTITYASIYARQGKDWETELEQRSTEEKKIAELELNFKSGGSTNEQTPEKPNPEKEETDDDADDDERQLRLAANG